MPQADVYLERKHFSRLLSVLVAQGYRVIGPQVRHGTIVFDDLDDVAQLPRGYLDQQSPGQYRLTHTDSPWWFAWVNGPAALKPWVFASDEPLWQVQRDAQAQLHFSAVQATVQPVAILGVRACDLAALALQDQHFLHGDYPDPYYRARRGKLLLIAVQCSRAAATCFCSSTGDGPHVSTGYDLVLSELETGFVLRAGSEAGNAILQHLPTHTASMPQLAAVEQRVAQAALQQRQLPRTNIPATLMHNLAHPHWQEVAQRCLACGNCTQVCPTCFCHREEDRADLNGEQSTHARVWDSCFTAGHSYIHGITLRANTEQRYRQWLTHKFATWQAQYGRSGCVGCGRCITWCPVGIDVTEELAQLCEA